MASADIYGFGPFRVQLADKLSTENILRLAVVFELSSSKIGQLKDQKAPGILFTEFITEEGIISPTDISRLTDALYELNLGGIAEEVRHAWDASKQKKWKSESQLYTLKLEGKKKHHTSVSNLSSKPEKASRESRLSPISRLPRFILKPFTAVYKGKRKHSRSNSDISARLIEDNLQEDTAVEQQRHYQKRREQRNLGDLGSTDNNPFKGFLIRLGLCHKLSIKDILKLREYHVHINIPVTPENVVGVFLSRLMSHDYRAPYAFSELFKNTVNNIAANSVKKEVESEDWINAVEPNELPKGLLAEHVVNGISCRDGVFATVVSSDPFLLQEILGKMTACQLAVPLLLPNPLTSEVTMLLWGLRQIKKTWVEDSGEVHEVQITEKKFPVVAFLRLGNVAISKSTTLNLILGTLQGKDDHPIFFSSRQDVKEPEYSKGVLEAFWFQPTEGRKTKHSLLSATCFLNLRGDATNCVVQQTFACRFATLVVVFVNASNKYTYKAAVNTISNATDVLLVALSETQCETSVLHPSQQMTVCTVGTRNDKLIAEILCAELSNKLSKENVKQSSLAIEGVELSTTIGITVDMFFGACCEAKHKAMTILDGAQKSPKAYKASALKLQETWRQWTKVDKDTSWQANDGNIEAHLNKRKLEKRKHRRHQYKTGASTSIKHFYEGLLIADDEEVQYLTIWLNILLNEISQTTLSNLITRIQMLGNKSRNTKKQITAMYNEVEENDKFSKKDKKAKMESVRKLEAQEEQLHKDRISASQEFDDSSVGFEHLLREIGQLYESHCEVNIKHIEKKAHPTTHTLPEVAARLLLLGQPIEILDGDACHVPVLWVKGLLQAVQSQIKFDAKLFIISVLGVQSSGKSTLLNSMFGVRFAVSAGRCTRGVYMQMLEIEGTLRGTLGYDFLVLIDTEGLRAPEKSIAGTPDLDNELATFALCISNMTLINIGGQTVGDDLTDVLQVAAHAFIRMKEVQLQSSCRLVQQFVADLTARAKNENSTQSIKQKLDEAIKTAAKEEGMHRRYRQFTDVFNILNDNDVRDLQYIPSLWRSSTAPPNHSYSEKVLELKASLLDGKGTDDIRFLNISEFGKRIEDVWNAVKQEDFVFNFRNSIIMAQYKNFQTMYQRLKINLRKDTMSFELERRDQIANATEDSIDKVLSQSKLALSCVISEKYDAAKTQINKLFEDNNFSEVKKLYKDQFAQDLQLYKEATVIQIENRLDIIAQKSREKKITADTHLPKFEAELKQRVFSVARGLHNKYSKLLKEGKKIPEKEIRRQFDDVWNSFMRKMQRNYSSQSDNDVREQVNELLTKCIINNAGQTNLSKYLKGEVQHKDNYHTFSANSGNGNYKEDVQKLVQIFENDNTARIDSAYKTITDTTQRKPSKGKTCKYNDILSRESLQSLQTGFELLLTEIRVCGLNDIQWHFTCAAGFTISRLQENWKGYFGKFNPEFSTDIGLNQTSESRESILANIKSKLEQKLSSRGILTSAWRYTKELLKKGVLHRQSQDDFQSKIQKLMEQLTYDQKSYESGKLISDFLDSAIEIIQSNLGIENREDVWSDVCFQLARSIHKQIESSKLESNIIDKKYPDYVEGCFKIKEMILNMIKIFFDQENVNQMEEDLTPDIIAKVANLPSDINLQSAIDINILSKLEKHQTDDYTHILTTIKRIKYDFLSDIPESGSIDEALISDLIDKTQRQFPKYLETDEVAYMILHMCAWALPICAASQVSYEKANNIVLQLEEMKEAYFKDFKNWCLDSANDTRQAEELYALMKSAILACVKNKICTTLFGLLAHEGDVFTSRQHLIRLMLRQLAVEEDFKGYLLYIKDHDLFTKNWIKNYIVNICSKRTTKLNIKNLASSEIKSTADFTRLCFVESLSHVGDEGEVLSPVNFLVIFREKCKDKMSINVNESDFNTLKKFSSSIKEYETYQKEFLNLLKNLPDQLMRDLNIPKQNDVDGTAKWLQRLPVSLDIELAKRVEGCKNQCPFCGSVCDETTAKHNKHLAALHYPSGINGTSNKRTKELVCDVCTSEVATDSRYYPNCNCDEVDCDCRWFYYKEYEKEYPDWYIRPIPDNEPTAYWKWVMTKFNTVFSDHYNSEEARIPDTWREITKSEALDSLDAIYH